MEGGFGKYWIVFDMSILWFLMTTGQSQTGMISASPGTLLPLASSVSITCSLAKGRIAKSLNIKRKNSTHESIIMQLSNSNSISVNDTNLSPRKTTYKCNADDKLVSGIYIEVGMPPDQPVIVSCEQEGDSGSINCSWKTGRDTYIKTHYTLQLTQKTLSHNVTVFGDHNTSGIQSANLPATVTRGDGEYIAVVMVFNGLGKNSSLPHTFTYFDAVKPHPPNQISITFHHTSSNCTVNFHDPQDPLHFRLRYRPIDSNTWKMVEILRRETYTLTDLQPFTSYEFQASCKFLIEKGKWSNWSQTVTEQTPEAVPSGRLDVWYRLQDINDHSQNIVLFWKTMSTSQARGWIKFYTVVFHKGKKKSPAYSHTTTSTWLTRNIEKAQYVIAVSAHNSKGNSPPTYINITTEDISGLPTPLNVLAKTSGSDNVTVTWEMPLRDKSLSEGYIVEWEEQSKTHQSYTNWVNVSMFTQSAIISDGIKPYVCYRFRVYALWGRRAGIANGTTGSTNQKAPLVGPEFQYKVWKDDSILVTWDEIPAEKQMGCIVQYTIYLHNLLNKSCTQVKVSSNQIIKHEHVITNIERNVDYLLWMTGSTTAGESTKALVQQIYLSEEGTHEDYVILIICVTVAFSSAFSVACVCCISSVKQRMLFFLSGFLPFWCSKKVPDPANCEWALEFKTHKKDKMGLFPNPLSKMSSCDETVTLEIEEMESGDEIQFFPTTFVIEHIENETCKMEEIICSKNNGDVTALPKLVFHPQESCPYNSLKSHDSVSIVPVSDYLINQNNIVDYLPTNMLHSSTDSEEDSSEDESFPQQSFMPTLFVAGGKLRLDAVKINCHALEE